MSGIYIYIYNYYGGYDDENHIYTIYVKMMMQIITYTYTCVIGHHEIHPASGSG